MKPKFRAPSGPRTPDYAPAARRILFLSLLLLFLLLSMGNLQKSREALADRIAPSILRFHILANSDSRNGSGRKAGGAQLSVRLHPGPAAGTAQTARKPSSRWLSENKTQPGNCRQPVSRQKADALLRAPVPGAQPGFPPGSTTTWSFPAAPTTPPGSSSEKERATTGGASSTRGSAFWMKSAKRFPEESRRELQDKLNQGDYPLLEDHRPDTEYPFFLFP